MGSDEMHVRRLKNGDSSSFEYLYKKWSGKLYNFVMQIANKDSYLAEEIVQSVFVRVWETQSSLDPNKQFASYIFTIAKNLVVNNFQRRMYESSYLEKNKRQIEVQQYNLVEKDIDAKALIEIVDSLVELLPPARREIFILSRRDHLSNKDIAEQLNISVNTVESQMTKALAFLRKQLAQHYQSLIIPFLFILTS